MVELVVSSADKQRQGFTQVQGPRVEVTPLRPACLLLIREYMVVTRGSQRDADLARVLVVLKVHVRFDGPPSLYIIGWVSGVRNRLSLHIRKA